MKRLYLLVSEYGERSVRHGTPPSDDESLAVAGEFPCLEANVETARQLWAEDGMGIQVVVNVCSIPPAA